LPFVTYYGHCHLLDGATLFSKVDSNKLRINVKNKMTLIDTKFDADLVNISEVTSRKTKWPRFFGLPCRCQYCAFNAVALLVGLQKEHMMCKNPTTAISKGFPWDAFGHL